MFQQDKETRLEVGSCSEWSLEVKAPYDVMVAAAFTAALVAFHSTPDKVN